MSERERERHSQTMELQQNPFVKNICICKWLITDWLSLHVVSDDSIHGYSCYICTCNNDIHELGVSCLPAQSNGK